MTTPPCTKCKHCINIAEDKHGDWWFYCEIDKTWMEAEWAYSDLVCEMYEQKLDDNETQKP